MTQAAPTLAETPESRLEVRFLSRRSVLASSRSDVAGLSLFVPTIAPLAVGDRVFLELSFGDCDARYELSGVVSFLRQEGRGLGQERGVGISFEGEGKRAAAQMLAFCAGRPAAL